MKKVTWEWDIYASRPYNVMACFEATLINMGIIDDYSDIEATEDFVKKYGVKNERNKRTTKEDNVSNLRFERVSRRRD
jgi:hypothetical protein